jgi:uncharacterized protein (DUF433 family)
VAKLKFDPAKTLSFADPRDLPTYGIPEAAHYLRIPTSTLRSWILGQDYTTSSGKQRFEPLIALADPENKLLSFRNLAEAHVLRALRHRHDVKMIKIRSALDYIARKMGSKHPLISQDFETNGVGLFVTQYGLLLDASAQGQYVMREIIEQHLKRLERDESDVIRLYPFTRPRLDEDNPKTVCIDPRIGFGRLIVASIGVPTTSLNERFSAGESIEHLAEDYGCEKADVEEAIRCENWPANAAA